MAKNASEDYPGLTEGIVAILRAQSALEIYAILYRFLNRNCAVLCAKAVEKLRGESAVKTVWEMSSSLADSAQFPIPPEALAGVRPQTSVHVLPVEREAPGQAGGLSLLVAYLEEAGGEDLHRVLFWIGEDGLASDPAFLLTAHTIASLASQVLSLNELRQCQALEHKLLQEILESIPQALVAVSMEGAILACNRNAEFIFHLKRSEVSGTKYQEALPSALAEAMSGLIHSAADGSDQFDDEFDFPVDRRTKLRIGISLAPMLDREDHPTGYVFVIRDMTLRHEVQNLRKLHQMNLEFVHTVSHEIKAPLTTVLLGAGNLLAQIDGLSQETVETLQMIEEGAKRIQDLVNDLLDVTRLESGHVELDVEVGDLCVVVKKVVMVYQSLQKVEIRLRMEENLPPLKFDRKKILRALENLIVNAIKYSLGTPVVEVSVTRRGDAIRVAVGDKGVGIAAEQLPYVWEKFYRGLSPTTANVTGSGLGLTIVKHIISMHGGEVEAESELGKGSVFAFTLPLRGRSAAVQ